MKYDVLGINTFIGKLDAIVVYSGSVSTKTKNEQQQRVALFIFLSYDIHLNKRFKIEQSSCVTLFSNVQCTYV